MPEDTLELEDTQEPVDILELVGSPGPADIQEQEDTQEREDKPGPADIQEQQDKPLDMRQDKARVDNQEQVDMREEQRLPFPYPFPSFLVRHLQMQT